MKWLVAIVVISVYCLHQDWWLWHDRSLLFGFLPVGLAYHAGYAILASCMMAFLVRYAWPEKLEQSVSDLPEVAHQEAH